MKAMILAAGKGTRMLPLTETKPKALIEVQGVSLLEHTIRYLKYFQVDDIIINIHHHAQQIVDYIKKKDYFGINITFSDESNELLDTGGGLYKARWFFDDQKPFILTSSDVITDLDIEKFYRSHLKKAPLVSLAVKHRKSSRDFLFDRKFQLCGWHNKTTNETRLIKIPDGQIKMAFSTIHVIDPSIFELITERGCFSIIDVYLRLAGLSYPILGFAHDQSVWYECGRIDNLNRLNLTPEIETIYKKYHKLSGK